METSFSDLNRIIDVGRLVLALAAIERPPFVTGVGGQELQGSDPWLAQRLATALGVELEVDRQAKTSDDVIDQLAADKADLALGAFS